MGNVIKIASWVNVLPDCQKVAECSVGDLLELARELFDALANADTADTDLPARAKRLRLILAELSDRATRLAPRQPSACSCGQTFGTPEELDDHFMEIFIPANDRAPNGLLHTEVTP